ncbi:hypothetical protein B0H14DRAFT_3480227 [Mycena olivaceomarginata]|nr:hypothetical protein B0H14DRAFT_3480227 [Mycena olivaceomarginata]
MSNRKRAKDPKREPKKRGSASDFQGSRHEFLTLKIPEYIAAGKKKGKEAKTEGLEVFWAELFNEYFRLYLWDLPLDQEPEPNASERKGKTKKDLKAKIKRWFSRQRAGAMGIQGNPFFEHLSQLCRKELTSAPKRMSKLPEMLEDEPQDVRDRMKRECDEAHARDLEAFDEDEDVLPDVDAEVQSQCRENFLAIVQPLLAGLHAYTGLTLNIIGGRINDETQQFETMSANAGVVDGKDWARWGPVGYAACLKYYLKFVHAGYLEAHNLVDAGASSSSTGRDASSSSTAPGRVMPPDDDVEMPAPEEVTNGVSASSQDVDADDLMIASDLRLPPSLTSTDEAKRKGVRFRYREACARQAVCEAPRNQPGIPPRNPPQSEASPCSAAAASDGFSPSHERRGKAAGMWAKSASAPPADEGLLPPMDADGKLVNKMVVPTMWGLEGLNYAMRNELLEIVVLVHLGLNQVAGFLGMKRTKTGKGPRVEEAEEDWGGR